MNFAAAVTEERLGAAADRDLIVDRVAKAAADRDPIADLVQMDLAVKAAADRDPIADLVQMDLAVKAAADRDLTVARDPMDLGLTDLHAETVHREIKVIVRDTIDLAEIVRSKIHRVTVPDSIVIAAWAGIQAAQA